MKFVVVFLAHDILCCIRNIDIMAYYFLIFLKSNRRILFNLIIRMLSIVIQSDLIDFIIIIIIIDNMLNKTTLQVAALVSNCSPSNNRRTYTAELDKHISVHVYGHCGKYQCPSNLQKKTPDGGLCGEWVTERYKFYLAFENSNCKDYITEKLMMNGLR